MIPVASPVSQRRHATPSFECQRCHGIFRVRGPGKKLFCLDCAHVRELAKIRAMQRVKYAIKAGKLLPPTKFSCVDCGADADRYDHRDYSKQLEVSPVCCKCNSARGQALLGDE